MHLLACLPRNGPRNHKRLIKASVPKPCPVQWHWHQYRLWNCSSMTQHQPRHHRRETQLAPIFQTKHHAARNLPIIHGRMNAIMGTPEYRRMTIRNWNTTTTLLDMLERLP